MSMSAAGKWQVTMETPIGTQKFTWNLQQSTAGWSGTMQSQAGSSELKGVRVDGDQVAFESKVNSPMGSIHVAFSGAVAGDRIGGTCKTAYGDMPFSAERV
jgi:hypothetical protein